MHRFDPLVQIIGDKRQYTTSIMTAPHHGSDVTNLCILESGLDTRPLQRLLSLFQKDARRVFVISALVSMFGHPGKKFLDTSICRASGAAEHYVCYGLDNLLRAEKLTEAEVYCTEMTQDFKYFYSEGQNAVCDRRMQAPQMKCKAPSKRLFI